MPMIGMARRRPRLRPRPCGRGAPESLWRAERAGDVARVHRREVLWPQEDAARRKFLDNAANQGGGERDVIPACDERVNLPWLDPDAGQRGQRGVQALLGPRGAVADAGVALLLVVADQADAVGARGLDQGDAAVVSRGSDPRQVDTL